MTKETYRPFRYGVAVFAVVAAIAVLFIPVIGKGLGTILFLAVLISAWHGGLGPGLLATALFTVVGVFFLLFVEPDRAPWRFVSLLLFVAVGVIITMLVEALHAARRQAEASQQWLKAAILEASLDCVITIDHQGRVIEWNTAAEKTFGYRRSEAVGRELAELVIPPLLCEQHRRGLAHLHATGEGPVLGKRIEMPAMRADGCIFPVELSIARIPVEPPAYTAYVRDITERQHTEAVQARLASIVESSEDAIIGKDLDGVITDWNTGAERIFGYAAEEIVGRSIDLIIPADRRDEESEALARMRRGERVGHYESVRISRDGRSIHVSTTVSPIRDGIGRTIGASRIIRDITDRKRAEERLRASERMLAQSQRMAHVGSWELSFDGSSDLHFDALRWSDECFRIFGYEPDQVAVTQDLFFQAVHPDDRDAVTAAVARALRENGPYAIEHRIARPDGTERVVVESAEIITDSSGRPIRMLGTCQDITDRKRAEEEQRSAWSRELEARAEVEAARRSEQQSVAFAAQLERSNRDLEQFASAASHDLQEPLRKIQAFGNLLLEGYPTALGAQGRAYLQRIQDSSRRMQALINDLLTYSRVASKSSSFVSVDLGQVAKEVVADLEERIRQTGGRVEVDDLPTLDAVPTQMRQLLQNLIGNALKFHAPGRPPFVQVRSCLLAETAGAPDADADSSPICRFTVQDNGIGFADKFRDRIFDVFQRLHGPGEYEGTGMGLAISRKILERHGGRITAASVPGQGTTFTVTLPIRQPLRRERP